MPALGLKNRNSPKKSMFFKSLSVPNPSCRTYRIWASAKALNPINACEVYMYLAKALMSVLLPEER